MTLFSFELMLLEGEYPSAFQADEFLDHVEDALFEAFEGDVTPAMVGGVPVLYCSLMGNSRGDVLDRVTNKIEAMGLHPSQLLMRMEKQQGKGMFERDLFA